MAKAEKKTKQETEQEKNLVQLRKVRNSKKKNVKKIILKWK